MMDMFYIFKLPKKAEDERETGERWLLRIKDSHFTMSALNSKEEVLKSLHNIVIRYGSRREIMKRLRYMERDNSYRFHSKDSIGRPSQVTLDRWQQEYSLSLEHEEDVREVVSKALKEVVFNQPVHKIKKATTKLSLAPDSIAKVESKEESPKEIGEVKAKIKSPVKGLKLIRKQ